MVARFPVEIERFAVARDGTAEMALDDLGMLAATGSVLPGGSLLKVADLGDGRSFCLLGEPGAGKSTALRAVTQGVPNLDDAQSGKEAILWVSLAEVADSGLFRERVTSPVLDFVTAGGAPGDLALVLDGLDECPMSGGGKVLAGLLKNLLGRRGVSACGCLSVAVQRNTRSPFMTFSPPRWSPSRVTSWRR